MSGATGGGYVQAGLDEAGRGPVVGPLVIGLVAAKSSAKIARLGVRDSKTLTPTRREELAEAIRAKADHVEWLALEPAQLDASMKRRSLNDVEVEAFAQLASRLVADIYFLDACDVDAARFGRNFLQHLGRAAAPRVVSEHKADTKYPLVSAASIIAKVERDRRISEIAARLEPDVGLPLGSGYAHDATTIAFLREHLERFGRLPDEARTEWATSRDLIAARWQRTLEV